MSRQKCFCRCPVRPPARGGRRRKVDDQRQLTLVFGVVDAAHSGGKLPPRRLFWPLRGGRQHSRAAAAAARAAAMRAGADAQPRCADSPPWRKAGWPRRERGLPLRRAAPGGCRVNALGQRSGLRGGRTAPPGLEQGKHLGRCPPADTRARPRSGRRVGAVEHLHTVLFVLHTQT